MSIFPAINFKAVQWPQTLKLHVLRAFCAGLVWAVVVLFAGGPQWWSAPIVVPAMYVIGFPFYLLGAKLFLTFMGDGLGQLTVGLVMLGFAIGIAVGDPLVYFIGRKWPDMVPTQKFRLLNFATVLFVLDPAKV